MAELACQRSGAFWVESTKGKITATLASGMDGAAKNAGTSTGVAGYGTRGKRGARTRMATAAARSRGLQAWARTRWSTKNASNTPARRKTNRVRQTGRLLLSTGACAIAAHA